MIAHHEGEDDEEAELVWVRQRDHEAELGEVHGALQPGLHAAHRAPHLLLQLLQQYRLQRCLTRPRLLMLTLRKQLLWLPLDNK